MGIVEKISLDDATMRIIADRAKDAGKTIDDEVVELLQLGLQAAANREALVARAKALRDALPPQSSDSLALLREDRDR